MKATQITKRYISTVRDYYQILGIDSNATQAQIKTAFYKLSLVYHPDKSTAVDAAIKFHDISEAYKILGNYKTRKQYDRGLINPQSYEAEPKWGNSYQPTNYKFYKNWTKQKMQPRGKTSIYDFDEFYRAHYADNLRKNSHINEQMKIDKEKKYDYQTEQYPAAIGIILFSMYLLFIGLTFVDE